MSLFDKIAHKLDALLSAPAAANPVEDEQAHMALLEQSSDRIRATVDAIRQGNLIAASSTTEDLRATSELRYAELRGVARPGDNSMSHVERLTARRKTEAQQQDIPQR